MGKEEKVPADDMPPGSIASEAEKLHAKKIRGKGRRKKITPTALKVIEAVVRNPDATQKELGEAAGLSRVGARAVLHRESTQELMRELMEAHPQLRRTALIEKLAEGVNATRVERFAKDGRVLTEKEDIDFRTRGFYLSLACEINGAKAPQKVELSGPNGAPLIPDTLIRTLEAMPEATLKLILANLARAE